MKTVIIGSKGQLGSDLWKTLQANGDKVIGLSHQDLDITNKINSRNLLKSLSPELIINCAAYVQVDKAEIKPSYAFQVNSQGSLNLAKISAELGAFYTYISTDYVFDGTKRTPYSTNDKPDPLSVYGESKLAGENAVVVSGVDALLIRTSWLYGAVGENVVRMVIQRAREGRPLQLVDDQTGSPTWAEHVAELTLDLVKHQASGTYHITDSGEASWYDLGREVLSICGLYCEIKPISTEDWGAPAPRPRYSVLDSSNTEEILGRRMTPWREALKKFLKDMPR